MKPRQRPPTPAAKATVGARIPALFSMIIVLLFVAVSISPHLAAQDAEAAAQPDFAGQARAALDQDDFARLEELCRSQLAASPDQTAARAYLACALAGLKKFEESAAELARLDRRPAARAGEMRHRL